jgi:hypothetical protein
MRKPAILFPVLARTLSGRRAAHERTPLACQKLTKSSDIC